ncbi:MAG: dienelactone hydrolase family protein, partial [Paracoccaceae bacterium]
PFDDEAFFSEWVGEAGDVALELHRYEGVGHYFLDRSLPDYNAAAAALCLERSLAFLERL